LFLIRKRIEIYNAKKLGFENKLKTNLLFDEEAMSAGSEIEASVVLLCQMLMVGFCCLLVRDSDYVVALFGKVNNVPITFQLYSNCGFFFSLHTVGPKDLGQLGPNIFVPIHTVMSCIIITNYLINMWLSEYKGLFHLLLFP
jgi:hypothetical protein